MSRLVRAALLMFALSIPAVAGATAQQGDEITIDGKVLFLNTDPLTPLLAERDWSPPEGASISSANWRGYLAHWAIDDGELVLVDATIGRWQGDEQVRESIRESLFPGVRRVVAEWYTGTLIVPDGKLVDYVHMGYGSTYDHYQVLTIAEGRVVRHLSLTAEQFDALKQERFAAFVDTEEFAAIWRKLGEGDSPLDEERRLDFIRSFYAEQYLSR